MAEIWMVALMVCPSCGYIGQPWLDRVTTRICRQCRHAGSEADMEHLACRSQVTPKSYERKSPADRILLVDHLDRYSAFVYTPVLARMVGTG